MQYGRLDLALLGVVETDFHVGIVVDVDLVLDDPGIDERLRNVQSHQVGVRCSFYRTLDVGCHALQGWNIDAGMACQQVFEVLEVSKQVKSLVLAAVRQYVGSVVGQRGF